MIERKENMNSNIKVNIKINLPEKSIKKYGIDESTAFEAYFKNGVLIVNTITAEEEKEMEEDFYQEGFADGHETGVDEGFDDGIHEGREEGYLVGYKMGFDDCRFGEKFNNAFLSEEDFVDCLDSEMERFSEIDVESFEINEDDEE